MLNFRQQKKEVEIPTPTPLTQQRQTTNKQQTDKHAECRMYYISYIISPTPEEVSRLRLRAVKEQNDVGVFSLAAFLCSVWYFVPPPPDS
jgi:hypothetical protein